MESRSETAMARECHLKAPLANTSSNKDIPPHPSPKISSNQEPSIQMYEPQAILIQTTTTWKWLQWAEERFS